MHKKALLSLIVNNIQYNLVCVIIIIPSISSGIVMKFGTQMGVSLNYDYYGNF